MVCNLLLTCSFISYSENDFNLSNSTSDRRRPECSELEMTDITFIASGVRRTPVLALFTIEIFVISQNMEKWSSTSVRLKRFLSLIKGRYMDLRSDKGSKKVCSIYNRSFLRLIYIRENIWCCSGSSPLFTSWILHRKVSQSDFIFMRSRIGWCVLNINDTVLLMVFYIVHHASPSLCPSSPLYPSLV